MKKVFKITAYIVGSILGIGFVFFIIVFMYDAHRERARQSWEWQHYTGYRLVDRGYDTAHGIFLDKKTNTDCSMLAYPGYSGCPAQVYVVNGEPLEQVCKKWEDKHPIGSPVDRLYGQLDSGEKIRPEGIILDVPEGCKGPLETAYEEKTPKIDFDALAKKYGAIDPAPNRVIEIHGGETLHIAPAPAPKNAPLLYGGLVPLVYLGHQQKFSFVCGVFGEPGGPTDLPEFLYQFQ